MYLVQRRNASVANGVFVNSIFVVVTFTLFVIVYIALEGSDPLCLHNTRLPMYSLAANLGVQEWSVLLRTTLKAVVHGFRKHSQM